MIRTLIADDDALLRAALRTMVDWEALGYTLVGDCTNGLQVLELLQRTTVDLLITDMKMPLLDGLGLIRRLRLLDGKPLILDLSYFLCSEVKDLTEEIAADSIYTYLEQSLNMQIVTSKRQISVESANAVDETHLALGGHNCVAVIRSQSYNTAGVMFEYTESRHCPDFFGYTYTAIRSREIV